jgi:small conductance mechanosensitive channel
MPIVTIRGQLGSGAQEMVGRELRRRIKNTFDSRGIEIPFPHVSVYFGEASKPFPFALTSPTQDAVNAICDNTAICQGTLARNSRG